MINRLKKHFHVGLLACIALTHQGIAPASSDIDAPHVPMALAISGGISLGSYEAGLNWAIVKQLKIAQQDAHYRVDKYPPRLTAVSGASAGGINALVSAMGWCMDDSRLSSYVSDTITNNLFRDIWLGVGFDNLLPANPGEYEATDGLLSRKAFDQVINRIRVLLDQPVYKSDCHIPLALTVTRTIAMIMDVNGIKVRNQRFVIPVSLSSDPDRPGHVRLHSHVVSEDDPLFGNVIYLQARPGSKIDLNIEPVIQAVLASSAFPVAFGRVKLDYCIRAGVDMASPDSSDEDARCPAGYGQGAAYFVDGGVFDNVPLGLAKALAESSRKPADSQYHYIYLDPGSRRPFNFEEEISGDKSIGFGLKSQLHFIGGAIQTGGEYELYNVLRSDDWSGQGERRILLSSRHPPITGEFLAHFGAFIDSSFREYDYYAGVYDALINIAEYRCHVIRRKQNSDQHCVSQQARQVYHVLLNNDGNLPDVQRARELIGLLAKHEHGTSKDAARWQWAWQNAPVDIDNARNNVLIVAGAILRADKNKRDPDLEQLIAELPQSFDLSQSGFVIRRIIRYRHQDSSKWFYPLASRASVRLLELEKEEYRITGASLRTLAGSAALGIETMLGDQDDFVWNQSTGKNDAFRLLPHEISYDLANTGWSMAWEPRWLLDDHWSLNLKLAPVAMQRVNNERKIFSQLDLYASYHVSDSLISAWGIGPSYTRLRSSQNGAEQENLGYAAYMGLLGNKLRLTIGKRGDQNDFFNDAFYIYIGITDIPGISYWVHRTYD